MSKRLGKAKDLNEFATIVLVDALGDPPPITSAGNKNPAAADVRPTLHLNSTAKKVVAKGPATRMK